MALCAPAGRELESLTWAKIDEKPAIEVLFKRFEAALTKAGFLAMGGQIIDATIVAAPNDGAIRWIFHSGYHRNVRKQSERGVPPNVIV